MAWCLQFLKLTILRIENNQYYLYWWQKYHRLLKTSMNILALWKQELKPRTENKRTVCKNLKERTGNK